MPQMSRIYPGMDKDEYGGMTHIGRIIRDAWVFGVLPETETCENWNYQRIEEVYDQVHHEWDKYGHLVSQLPSELQQRHTEIHQKAMEKARAQGWSPDFDLAE